MQMAGSNETPLKEQLLAALSDKSGDVNFAKLVEQVAAEARCPTQAVAAALRQLIDSGQVLVTFDWNLVAAAE
jgi:CII-binding regulator of phage lambda lysogenization HflD